MSQFIQFPPSGGIPTYPTLSAFPALAADGSAAIALDTDTLYIFNLGTASSHTGWWFKYGFVYRYD